MKTKKISTREVKTQLRGLMRQLGHKEEDFSVIAEKTDHFCRQFGQCAEVSENDEFSPHYFIDRLYNTQRKTSRAAVFEVFKGFEKFQQARVLEVLSEQMVSNS